MRRIKYIETIEAHYIFLRYKIIQKAKGKSIRFAFFATKDLNVDFAENVNPDRTKKRGI